MNHSFQVTIKVIWGKFLYFVHIKIHIAEKNEIVQCNFFPQYRAALTRRTVHNNIRNTNYERTRGQL